MKKFYISLLLFLIIYPGFSVFSQEIDLEMLSNISPEQLEIAKNQLDKEYISSEPQPEITESTEKNDLDIEEESALVIKKYGYNYFNTSPTSIAAVGDLPLPNDYKISLRDQFTIILSGTKQSIFDLTVNLDGTILFPELGTISVVGETFSDVKNKLRNLIDQSYIGVQIDVALKNLSAKKITIVGAVNMPGTYLVNPFSTISSALGYSGGISEIGTLRKIKLVRANGDIYFFDLYDLLIDGNRTDDITVEAGDVIVIDAANQFISLTGEIKRPAIYEIKENEDISDLISFGMGLTEYANQMNIEADVLDIESGTIKKIVTNDIELSLSDVIAVNFNKYLNKELASVEVLGAVKEQGFYSLNDYKNLEELIDNLEFIDVYPWLAILEQFDENNLSRETILFSLKDEGTYRSVTLLPNSKVYFANRDLRSYEVRPLTDSLIDDYKLTINHMDEAYELPVYGRFKLKEFTDFLGLDMSEIDPEATYISPLDNFVSKTDYREMSFDAKKYHTVSFRSPINDLITVKVSGAINYPGSYTLQSDATISQLYEVIGSFKSEAFLDGIIFTRESIRERQRQVIESSSKELQRTIVENSIESNEEVDLRYLESFVSDIDEEFLGRIAGNFSPYSETAENTTLIDGDSIFVPKNPNVINVLGEVFNPIAFSYSKNLTINDAINLAGGTRKIADLKRVYVIRANGVVERGGRSIFTGNIKLKPGDSVVVPRRISLPNSALNSIIPVTNILSDIAFSAAAIESLSNSN